jgi:hypothetical protein
MPTAQAPTVAAGSSTDVVQEPVTTPSAVVLENIAPSASSAAFSDAIVTTTEVIGGPLASNSLVLPTTDKPQSQVVLSVGTEGVVPTPALVSGRREGMAVAPIESWFGLKSSPLEMKSALVPDVSAGNSEPAVPQPPRTGLALMSVGAVHTPTLGPVDVLAARQPARIDDPGEARNASASGWSRARPNIPGC